MGDWRDAAGTPQGAKPYASTRIVDDDTAKAVEWDVTDLVRDWLGGTHPNQGFFLRSLGGTFKFRSREHADEAVRPQLVVTTAEGTVTLAPEADTYLDRSTYRHVGREGATPDYEGRPAVAHVCPVRQRRGRRDAVQPGA